MKVGRFYGIDVHVHWTFWLLIAIYLVSVAFQEVWPKD